MRVESCTFSGVIFDIEASCCVASRVASAGSIGETLLSAAKDTILQ